MKKLLALLLTVTMLCGTAITALAENKDYPQRFYDVPKDHWAFEYIAELVDRGVIAGYEDGSFKPNNTVTRAEFAKIMVCAASVPTTDNNVYFTDMQGHWAIPYVNAARNYLTAYSDNTYRPNQAAVREDVTMAMVRLKGYDVSNVDFSYLSGFTDTDSISNNVKAYVAVAVEKGLISGFEDNTFRGQGTLTRAEAATLLWKAFQYGNDNKVTDTSSAATQQNVSQTTPIVTPQTTIPQTTPTQNTVVSTPTIAPITETTQPVATEKPYKVDTLAKADVSNIALYTFDGNNTIYYSDNNAVYSVDTRTGDTNEVLTSDDVAVDNDEMTLDNFEIDNIFYQKSTNELFVSGSYKTVKTANNVNNAYLYSIRNGNIAVVTDEWAKGAVIGLTSLSDVVDTNFIETDGYVYYWEHAYMQDWLIKYDIDDFSDRDLTYQLYDREGDNLAFSLSNPANDNFCTGFTDSIVLTAIGNDITAYNYKGKELYTITSDDYDIADSSSHKIKFDSVLTRLLITPNNNIIFYDTNAKAFRIISENK